MGTKLLIDFISIEYHKDGDYFTVWYIVDEEPKEVVLSTIFFASQIWFSHSSVWDDEAINQIADDLRTEASFDKPHFTVNKWGLLHAVKQAELLLEKNALPKEASTAFYDIHISKPKSV